MTGHLYLHIGPPKSGTTSLQDAFGRIRHSRFVYGGVYQPRELNSKSLASRLHCMLNNDDQSVGMGVREEISRFVEAGKHVLISEEMLLLTQGERTWPKKLKLLNDLLDGIPTTVIVSLRDPAEGVPSLYQQLFNWLPLRHKISYASFCESEKARCYDFGEVRERLDQLGFSEIRYISFDAICNGRISSSEVFGDCDILDLAEMPIGHINVGEKVEENRNKRKLDGITLKSFGRLAPIRWLVDHLGIRQTRIYRRLVSSIEMITFKPPGYRDLIMPRSAAVRFRAGYLQALAALETQRPKRECPSSAVSRDQS